VKKRGRPAETERYEKAATDALTLVDWCIEYFADNRQRRIASQLARRRDRIRARMQSGRRG
jgi:hypothetical protein